MSDGVVTGTLRVGGALGHGGTLEGTLDPWDVHPFRLCAGAMGRRIPEGPERLRRRGP